MKAIGKRGSQLYPNPPVCNFDMFIEVSPLAIMALVGVTFDLVKLAPVFAGAALVAAVQYIAGLIVIGRRPTAAKISRLLGGRDHDALTRLREGDRWNVSKLMVAFIRIVCMLGVRGYLAIDDTLIPHPRGKKMKGVYWDHDHAQGRNVLGSRLVVLLWSDGFFRIPVAYAFWHKKGARPKYRTKNEIARTLLRWVIAQGIRPEYVAFDNWYASKENFKLIVKELRLEFVTKLKKNRRLVWEGKKLQARTIGRRLLRRARIYCRRDTGKWARATRVRLGELPAMTFVVVRDDLDGQGVGIRYLLASNPRLSAKRVVERYGSRWIIETFFEDLKGHLGLSSYQGRSLEGQMCHVGLCFAACVVLDSLRRKSGMTLGEAKEAVCRLVFARTPSSQWQLVSLEPAPAEGLEELEDAKKMVSGWLWRVSKLRLPRRLKSAS